MWGGEACKCSTVKIEAAGSAVIIIIIASANLVNRMGGKYNDLNSVVTLYAGKENVRKQRATSSLSSSYPTVERNECKKNMMTLHYTHGKER